MRIVHCITTLGVGGAEKHLLWLATEQQKRGHEVSVLYLKGEGELAPSFTEREISVDHVPLGSLLQGPAVARVLVERTAGRGVNIFHTHLLKADAVGALARPRMEAGALVSSKHNDERALLSLPIGLAHGWLMKRADAIVALSDHVAAFTSRHGRVPAHRIRRIYYGVDGKALQPKIDRKKVRKALGIAQNAPLLISVGRLSPQKDHPTLLRSFALLPEDTQLLVVGGDPFGDGEARLPALAEELGVATRTHFLGIRDDVPDLLGASDLFVLSSLWEGLGLVFLEAMAVGLPVVATSVSAVPEVVTHGKTGWLVPPKEPKSLAEALIEALDHPAERATRGASGKNRLAEVFDLDVMVDQIMEVYEDALGERKS